MTSRECPIGKVVAGIWRELEPVVHTHVVIGQSVHVLGYALLAYNTLTQHKEVN